MSGQPHAPAVLLLTKEHSVPIELDVSGPPSWPGRFAEEQNLLPLPAPEPLVNIQRSQYTYYALPRPVLIQQITWLEIMCALIIHFSPLFLSRGGGGKPCPKCAARLNRLKNRCSEQADMSKYEMVITA